MYSHMATPTKLLEFAMEQILKSPSSLPIHLSSFYTPTLDNKLAFAINPRLGAYLKHPTATSHMVSFIYLSSCP